jgi:hypothetical protein
MSLFKKKPDPISDRARALSEEIARLESEIERLDSQLQSPTAAPRLRSTAVPHGATLPHSAPAGGRPAGAMPDPIFEEVDQDRLDGRNESVTTPDHYNELGVRKYDLPALWRRLKNHFRGPSATNPKLVSYLAAGGIQGLRPLRYEKRVARNRFIALVTILFLGLLGLLWVFLHGRK